MATRTIGTAITLSGEKQFNDGIKAMNSNLKNLRTDMAAVSAEYADNAGSIEALIAKEDILTQSVDQQRAKVDALKEMYKKQKDAYGENSAAADKYRQLVNQASVELSKQTKELEKTRNALKNAEKESKTYTPVTQRMAGAVRDTGSKIKSFASDVVDAARHTPVLGEAMDIAAVSAKGLTVAAKGAGVAVKGVGTAALGLGKVTGASLGALTKGVGAVTAASAAGVAILGAGAVTTLGIMSSMAKETAEAVKDIPDWKLNESQKAWKAYGKQLEAMDASVADAKAALAGVLLPMLSDLSTEGAAFLNDFTRDMTAAAGNTQKQTQVLSDYIVKGAQLIKEKLPEYISAGKELFSGLGEGLSEAGPELLDMGLDLVMDLLNGIIEYAPQLAEAGIALVTQLTQSLIDRGPDLMTSAVGMVTQIVSGLAQAAPKLIPMAGQLVTQLITALVAAAPDLLLAGMELILGIISGITSGLGDIANSAGQIIETAKSAFSEKMDSILSVGKDIVQGIWKGITNGTEWLYGKLSGWVDDVVGWIAKKLGIASPSKVMRDRVGVFMAQGVGVGWEQEMRKVNRQIADSINTSFSVPGFPTGPGPYVGRSYSTAGGKTVNLYITAKSLTEADISMLLDLVNRKLGEDL